MFTAPRSEDWDKFGVGMHAVNYLLVVTTHYTQHTDKMANKNNYKVVQMFYD